MARKRSKDKDNKSAAIRDYIGAHSGDGPTAIAAALNAAHGWSISPAYVSTIKNKMHDKPARGRRAKSASAVDEGALLQAKKFADQSGGIDQAKAALDLLGKLTS